MTKKEAQRNAVLNGGRGSGKTVRLIYEIIADLKKENRLLGERCNQLLKDKGDLTDKIADLKANCDLAIEGRDVKIKELELELTVEKDQHQEEINLHLHAEEYIKSLEKQIEKLKADLNNAIESAGKWYVTDPVYSMLVDIYNDNFEITKGVSN